MTTMTKTETKTFEHRDAQQYDEHIRRVVPAYQAFADITVAYCQQYHPKRATIAVVGVGTGHELQLLCQANANWQFVAIDPSSAMLAIAKERCQSFAHRISWHHGTLSTFHTTSSPSAELSPSTTSTPSTDTEFTVTVCLLVLHFLTDAEKLQLLTLIKQKSQGALLLLQRLQPANQRIAELELAHAKHAGLTPSALETMSQRLSGMPCLQTADAQMLYQQAGWQKTQVLSQMLNYQLCCLT